jgi:hypothetical protein
VWRDELWMNTISGLTLKTCTPWCGGGFQVPANTSFKLEPLRQICEQEEYVTGPEETE